MVVVPGHPGRIPRVSLALVILAALAASTALALGPAPQPCTTGKNEFPVGCIPVVQRSVFLNNPFPTVTVPAVLVTDQVGERFTITFAPSGEKMFIRWQQMRGQSAECAGDRASPECGSITLDPLEECLWTAGSCDYTLSGGTPDKQYALIYTIQYGIACGACAHGVQVFNGDDFAWGGVTVALLPAEAGLSAGITASPDTVGPGQRFRVTVTATNEGTDTLTDVMPAAPLAISGDGGARLLSGPDPPTIAALGPGTSASFTYELEGTNGGTVVFNAQLEAVAPGGKRVTADAVCTAGTAASSVRGAAAIGGAAPLEEGEGCPAEGPAAVEVSCVTLTDESPPTFEIDLVEPRVLPKSYGQSSGSVVPGSCGSAGCKRPLETKKEDQTQTTFKSVGQQVKVRADVAVGAGARIDALTWTIPGVTIESYTDITGYSTGDAELEFTHTEIRTDAEVVVENPTAPEDFAQKWFWKEERTGGATVEVEVAGVVGTDEMAEPFTCTGKLTYDKIAKSKRPTEDFFTACCDGEPSRVLEEHKRWHETNDKKTIFPGEDWLAFHRHLITIYEEYRKFFDFPILTTWDGTVPFGEEDRFGFSIFHEGRGTQTPYCPDRGFVPDAFQGLGVRNTTECPLPGRFRLGGVGSGFAGPDSERVIRPCHAERDYDGDGDEAVALGPAEGGAMEVVDRVSPRDFEKLEDFRDARELGCVLSESYHADVHLKINGSMIFAQTSPRDPIFWRYHRWLTCGKNVAPQCVIAAWEGARAAGPPGVTWSYPPRHNTLTKLDRVTVAFWEPVTGVTPGDLTVNGSPATHVTGENGGPYTFSGFAPPDGTALGGSVGAAQAAGLATIVPAVVELVSGNIRDDSGNLFPGLSWTYGIAGDADGDGVADPADNCPDLFNPRQENSDVIHTHASTGGNPEVHDHLAGDEGGDACDSDDDNDGIDDATELANGSDPLDPESPDLCPGNPRKFAPALCGCDVEEEDPDGDGVFTCVGAIPCEPGGCDDGDPCTTDVCDAALGCTTAPREGLAAATCACDRPEPAACAGEPVPKSLGRKVAKACKLLGKATAATKAKKAARHLKRAGRAWKKALRQVGKKRTRKKVAAPCVEALLQTLGDAQARTAGAGATARAGSP